VDLKEQTAQVLRTLTLREEKIVKMRFGLEDETLVRSAIISPCADAIDYHGESRSLRSTSTAFQGKNTGALATTLPRRSPSR